MRKFIKNLFGYCCTEINPWLGLFLSLLSVGLSVYLWFEFGGRSRAATATGTLTETLLWLGFNALVVANVVAAIVVAWFNSQHLWCLRMERLAIEAQFADHRPK